MLVTRELPEKKPAKVGDEKTERKVRTTGDRAPPAEGAAEVLRREL